MKTTPLKMAMKSLFVLFLAGSFSFSGLAQCNQNTISTPASCVPLVGDFIIYGSNVSATATYQWQTRLTAVSAWQNMPGEINQNLIVNPPYLPTACYRRIANCNGVTISGITCVPILPGNGYWPITDVGTTVFTEAHDVLVDPAGNTYVTGAYHGGPITLGVGNQVTLQNIYGFTGGYLAKYDNCGELVWAANIIGEDVIAYIDNFEIEASFDNSGNIVVSGIYLADIFIIEDFAGNPTNFPPATSRGTSYACKISPAGTVVASNTINDYHALENAVNPTSGNINLIGDDANAGVTVIKQFDPALALASDADVFTDRMETATMEWDNQNNLYVSGSIDGNITSTTSGVNLSPTTNNIEEICLIKYTETAGLAVSWQRTYNAQPYTNSTTASIYPKLTVNATNLGLSGTFSQSVFQGANTLTNSNGNSDIFLAQIDPANGNVLWTRKVLPPAGLTSNFNRTTGLAFDTQNNLTCTGYFFPSSGQGGTSNLFMGKYTNAGTQLFLNDYQTTYINTNLAYNQVNDEYLVSGTFINQLDLGGGNVISGASNWKMYVAKFDNGGNAMLVDEEDNRLDHQFTGVSGHRQIKSATGNGLNIMPNPNNGTFAIQFSDIDQANSIDQLVVKDIVGRELAVIQVNDTRVQIQLDAQPGIHLIEAWSKGTMVETTRFMVR